MQVLLALLVIFLFIARLIWQKKRSQLTDAEFIFWLGFWIVSGVLIVFIKDIDRLVARLGFSASGIQVLLYVSVALLFSQIFRLRLKLESMERNLTKLVENQATEEFNKRK